MHTRIDHLLQKHESRGFAVAVAAWLIVAGVCVVVANTWAMGM
jgi:hypothetical protein